MGVYLPNMEMPTNTDMAPTAVWVYPNGYAVVFKDNGKMKQYTQAIHVPPHGRLIDADLLKKDLENRWNVNDDHDFADKEVWHGIEEAPTVIGAEDGE